MQIISVRHDPQVNEPLVQCEVSMGSTLQHQSVHTAAQQAMLLGTNRAPCLLMMMLAIVASVYLHAQRKLTCVVAPLQDGTEVPFSHCSNSKFVGDDAHSEIQVAAAQHRPRTCAEVLPLLCLHMTTAAYCIGVQAFCDADIWAANCSKLIYICPTWEAHVAAQPWPLNGPKLCPAACTRLWA